MALFKNLSSRERETLPTAYVIVACCWLLAVLLFSLFSPGSPERGTVALVAYSAAAAFSLLVVTSIALNADESRRAFWTALCGGLFFRFAGDLAWTGFWFFQTGGVFTLLFHDVAYFVSYLLILTALLKLLASVVKVSFLATLDALVLMLSVGMLVWYFVLGPVLPVAEEAGWLSSQREVFMVLLRPVCDAGFLLLSSLTLSTRRRPAFARPLTAAFLVLLVSDGLYLRLRSVGPYEMDNWSMIVWALGFALLGLAALQSLSSESFVRELELSPKSVFTFWLGPLSPAVHYGLLLGWGIFNAALPWYVLAGGIVILAYLALRISLMSGVARRLRIEREQLAVRQEQGRLSEELHDTLKQSVYSTYVLLGAFEEARRREEPERAEEILQRAMEAAQEANHQVSRPVEELQALSAEGGLDVAPLLRHLLEDVREHFVVDTHEDLRDGLELLGPEERAAAYRIAGEAIWNAAKHSGARNIWVTSREVGSVLLLKVKDDGHGFSTGSSPGLGLPFMRARAKHAGGDLDIASRPGEGTTVQVRFDKT